MVTQYVLYYINISEACDKGNQIPQRNNSLLNSSLGLLLTIFTLGMFASSFQLYESGNNSKVFGILLVCIIVVIGLGFYLHKFNNIKNDFDKKVINNPMDVFK